MDIKKIKYAVIGYPVGHSLSPQMQNAGFEAIGTGSPYIKVEVPAGHLEGFVDFARQHLNGFNITVPHKQNIIPFLDEIEPNAQRGGSVNTVIIKNGQLYGCSTDGYGLEMALDEAFKLKVKDASVLFIGCGGAVNAVSFYFASQSAAKLFFVNRTVQTAEILGTELRSNFPGLETACCAINDDSRIAEFAKQANVVIQATSLGLNPQDPMPVNPELIKHLPYYDTIYKPTALLTKMRELGASTADGRTMLLHQGARSFEIWTGQSAPLNEMRRALEEGINSRTSTSKTWLLSDLLNTII